MNKVETSYFLCIKSKKTLTNPIFLFFFRYFAQSFVQYKKVIIYDGYDICY
jgi:hypothetical protein